MKVLVVKLSALGDILHAMPAVRRLILSGHETSWVVDARYSQVLDLFPGLSAIHVVDPKEWGRLFRSLRIAQALGEAIDLLGKMRAVRYDVALDLQGLLKSAAVARFSGSDTVVGMEASACRERMSALFYGRRVAVDLKSSVTDQIMTVVAAGAGVPEDPAEPGLVIPAEAARKAGEMTSGAHPFVLVAGAGWPTKVLPVPAWRKVAQALSAKGPVFVLSGSDEEREKAQAMVEGMDGARVLHRLDIRVLAGVLGQAQVVVGGDTGLVHLAAALGTPTVSFYGPSLGSRSGPVGEHHRQVQSDAECSPCFARECDDIVCMEELAPERIIGAVFSLQHDGLRGVHD